MVQRRICLRRQILVGGGMYTGLDKQKISV